MWSIYLKGVLGFTENQSVRKWAWEFVLPMIKLPVILKAIKHEKLYSDKN